MDQDTRQLTAAIRAGDAAAFTRFYHQRFDQSLSLAHSATGRDESFCMDVVQEAMLRVIRTLPVLETPQALDAWMRKATLSAAYDLLRSESRRRRRDRRAARPEKTSSMLEEERLEWIRERLAELDSGAWELLRLRYGVGWTLAQIGERIGLKAGAVDGRIARVSGNLRKAAPSGEDDA